MTQIDNLLSNIKLGAQQAMSKENQYKDTIAGFQDFFFGG